MILPTARRKALSLIHHASRRQFSAPSPTSTSTPLEVKKLGVVGAGQMGLGIALIAAQKAHLPVLLIDNSEASLSKSLSFADKLLSKSVAKSLMTESEASATRALLTPSTSLSSLSDVDFVIEAVPEIAELKSSIFKELAKVCPPHAILATNTSSISITQIAASTSANTEESNHNAPSRVIATHFMNPVPVQSGVEIISGLQTSPSTLSTALSLMKRLGKTPSVSTDTPGFLANRILMPYLNEAALCLEHGIGTRGDIDAIMVNGTGVPMGPLKLMDFIGLDTCLAVMETLQAGLGEKYRPAGILRKMVQGGVGGQEGWEGVL